MSPLQSQGSDKPEDSLVPALSCAFQRINLTKKMTRIIATPPEWDARPLLSTPRHFTGYLNNSQEANNYPLQGYVQRKLPVLPKRTQYNFNTPLGYRAENRRSEQQPTGPESLFTVQKDLSHSTLFTLQKIIITKQASIRLHLSLFSTWAAPYTAGSSLDRLSKTRLPAVHWYRICTSSHASLKASAATCF